MSGLQIHRWSGNTHEADPTRCAVVLPGRAYPVELPGLAFPLRALALDGWTVWHASWDIDHLDETARRATVAEAVSLLADATGGASSRLVIGKSFGTHAASWAADHGVPAIWLTPLLNDPELVEHIRRSPAPATLVAGTRDFTWDDEAAARTGKHVVRLRDAEHGLRTGDWRRELEIIGEITAAVESFARAAHPPVATRREGADPARRAGRARPQRRPIAMT